MNTLRFWSIACCLLGQVVFLGCSQDHLIPAPGSSKLRVKTITQDLPNNTATVSLLQYDAQGRISQILSYQTPDSTVAPVEQSVYQYDAQNHLTLLKRDVVRRAPMFGTNTETYALTYNPAGQLTTMSYQNNNASGGRWLVNPQYDVSNLVIGTSKSFDTGGLTTTESSTFTYANSDLVSVTTTGKAIAKGITFGPGTITTTYTYDTQVNPFYGLFVIPAPTVFASIPASGFISYYTYYGGIANLLTLSPNNVTSMATAGGTTNQYTYTYNSSNLPLTRVTTSGGSVIETLHFTYEPY